MGVWGGYPSPKLGQSTELHPLTMLQTSAQAVDFKVGRHFGEGQGANLTAPCSASRESTWTCDLTLAGGASGEIVWNAVVNIPATIPFTPASNFTQCTDLDGKVTQLSGGPIQIGGTPILLPEVHTSHAPAKKSARNGETGRFNTMPQRVAGRLESQDRKSVV